MTSPIDGSYESHRHDDSPSPAWLAARVERLEKELRASEALSGLQADLGGADSMEAVAELTLEFLEMMLDLEWGRVSLVEGELIAPTEAGGPAHEPEAAGFSLTSRAVRTGRAQHYPDPWAGFSLESAEYAYVQLAIPIIMWVGVVGVIHVGRVREHPFTDEDVGFAEAVADHVAAALEAVVRSKIGPSNRLRLEDYL